MWQRWLLATIKRHRKPISFEQIRAAALEEAGAEDGARLRPSPERSMRRALHSLVKGGGVVALGTGGQAEPHRYFPSIIVLGMSCDSTDEYNAIIDSLDERDVTALSAAMQRQMTSESQSVS